MAAAPLPPYFAHRDGIRIRPYRLEDGTPFFWAVMASRADVGNWLPTYHNGYTLDDARMWVVSRLRSWQSGQSYEFVVERMEDGEILGAVSLNSIHPTHRYASLSFWVRADQTGHGIATTAIKLLANFCFEVLGLSRLEFAIEPDNLAARGTVEKSGAVFEVLARNRLRIDGQPHDAAIYALIADDIYPLQMKAPRASM